MEITCHQRLEAAFDGTWGSISQNVVDEAVDPCRKWLPACVNVKGHHFEHLLK